MYLDFFGLQKRPFTAAPDPGFFYPSDKHKEALACILYAIEQRKGFALITGEVGAGKTTICRAALLRFEGPTETAVVTNTYVTPKQLIEAICEEFDLNVRNLSKFRMTQCLNDFLIERYAQNIRAVVIIDEAQNLDKRALEEVRLLGNLETDQDKLLQVILVGQPELRRKISSPELRQLNQRIAVKFHLYPLTLDEACDYIGHRLRIAGSNDRMIFGTDAMREIHEYAAGVPRIINLVCDHALLQAYVADERLVIGGAVRTVIGEIEGYYMGPEQESLRVIADPLL